MLRLSEAASLALHTMVLLADHPARQLSTREIADRLQVSEAHLSKVLQRLARLGLVRSERGPKGGFLLAKQPGEINLLEIYESIEGPLQETHCFKNTRICTEASCIFGGLLGEFNHRVRDYLAATRLPDLAGTIGGPLEIGQEYRPHR